MAKPWVKPFTGKYCFVFKNSKQQAYSEVHTSPIKAKTTIVAVLPKNAN